MSIGLGLFLGMLCLSVTIMYVATKDRWKWKRILGVLAVVVVGSPLLGLGALYVWERLPKPIVPQTELWGISLGMPKKEVLFRKGPPHDSSSSVPSSGRVREVWIYREDDSPEYWVHFERDSVEFVEADKTTNGDLPSLGGLYGYESQETIVDKLGVPTVISTSADGESRILSFARHRLFVVLARNRMTGIGIFKPDKGRLGIRWAEEDTTLGR